MFCGYAAKKQSLIETFLGWPSFFISLIIWAASMRYCWFSMGDRLFGYAPLAIMGAIAGTIIVSRMSKLIEERLPMLEYPLSFCGVNSLLILSLHYL